MRACLFAAALLTTTPAFACGQSTHVWVGIEAIDHLPDGDLKTLLAREDLFAHRVNGAMFPDGGYSPLTQDGYGETAHWEPFQSAYLDWIRETYDPPYTGEAAPHVAFLMGLAAHGMADQIFDGVYLTRALIEDGTLDDVDRASDISMTARTGPMPVVEDVVPYDTLVDVFEAYGQPTSRDTMITGQASLRVAVTFTSNAGQDPEEAKAADDAFPWTSANLTDAEVFCSPACIQPAIARYWETLWDRLHDRFDPDAQAILTSWPQDGAMGQPRDHTAITAQVSVAFARAVDERSLSKRSVRVVDADGNEHPTDYRMYYGNDSNVLNVWPLEDWAEDTAYTLIIASGVTAFDGTTRSEDSRITFSTSLPTEEATAGCGCDQGRVPWALGLLVVPVLLRRRR